MQLTYAGHQLLRTARRIISDVDKASSFAERVARVELGSLSIGFYTSLAGGPLREVLRAFYAQAPEVALELHEGNPADLLAKLRAREVELILTVLEVSSPDLETQTLWEEGLIAALPPQHPLIDHENLRWADLQDQPLVIRTWASGSMPYGLLAPRIAPNGYIPTREHFVSRESLLALVGIGAGITVLGASATELRLPEVVFRPIVDENATVPVSAVWLAGNDNPARGRFVSMVRDWRSAADARAS